MATILSTSFPWRADNQFFLYINGEQFFPRMLECIQQAQQSIALEMYLCESGKIFDAFRDALIAAAQRGVILRLILDDFGSARLNQHDRKQLTDAGIALRFFNPLSWRRGIQNLLRDHRKIMIVDNVIAFTGGAGLTDEFAYRNGHAPAWHDVMIEVRGSLANDWQQLFDRTWFGIRNHFKGRHFIVPSGIATKQPADGMGRVIASYGPQAHHVLQSLHYQIKSAQQRVWMVTPYFMPSWKLRQRLTHAARRGVDTRVLVPGIYTDHPSLRQASRRYYAQLLHYGVRIFEYQPSFIHAKIAVCDNWVSVGSTNFDRWNIRWNLDANQEVADINFATRMVTMIDSDFANSIELRQQDWQLRPWHQRWMEWFTGQLERLSGWLK